MHLLRVENEDNAVTCLKTIIDLHRSYKQILEDQVQPFINIVQEMYRNMEQTVKDQFDNPGTPLGQTVRVSLWTKNWLKADSKLAIATFV